MPRLLSLAQLFYNNNQKISIDSMFFWLIFDYEPCVFFEEDVKPYLHLKTTSRLITKLEKLIIICCKNFYHVQKL